MGILKTGKITVWTVLATTLTAVILMVYSLSSVSADSHNDDHDDNHGHSHATATPTPTPSPTPKHDDHDDRDNHDNHDDHNKKTTTPTPTPAFTDCDNDGDAQDADEAQECQIVDPATPAPTPAAQAPVYDGKGDGLGCAVHDCSGNKTQGIEGYGTGGQVLGASTMAGTGTFTENLYMSIMILGGTIIAFGLKTFKKYSI